MSEPEPSWIRDKKTLLFRDHAYRTRPWWLTFFYIVGMVVLAVFIVQFAKESTHGWYGYRGEIEYWSADTPWIPALAVPFGIATLIGAFMWNEWTFWGARLEIAPDRKELLRDGNSNLEEPFVMRFDQLKKLALRNDEVRGSYRHRGRIVHWSARITQVIALPSRRVLFQERSDAKAWEVAKLLSELAGAPIVEEKVELAPTTGRDAKKEYAFAKAPSLPFLVELAAAGGLVLTTTFVIGELAFAYHGWKWILLFPQYTELPKISFVYMIGSGALATLGAGLAAFAAWSGGYKKLAIALPILPMIFFIASGLGAPRLGGVVATVIGAPVPLTGSATARVEGCEIVVSVESEHAEWAEFRRADLRVPFEGGRAELRVPPSALVLTLSGQTTVRRDIGVSLSAQDEERYYPNTLIVSVQELIDSGQLNCGPTPIQPGLPSP